MDRVSRFWVETGHEIQKNLQSSRNYLGITFAYVEGTGLWVLRITEILIMSSIIIASVVAVLTLIGIVLGAIAIEDWTKSRKKEGDNRNRALS